MKRNQDNENNSNEVENIMLKGHLCHTSINDGGALANVCGRDEDLWLNVAIRWKITMAYAHRRAIDSHCL